MTQAIQSTPAPPPVPAIPVAPLGGAAPLVLTPGMLSSQDLAALYSRKNELSDQLNSVVGRRRGVQEQLRRANGADKTGLEQRLSVLDGRIARLESDIDENGKAIASLPAQRRAGETQPVAHNSPRNSMNENMVPMTVVFTIFVLSPIAVSVARMFWKRGSLPRPAPANPENSERLERMEQAIDSIAIEVERVSEGQRFVTRLLAEGRPAAALGQPAAEKVQVPVVESVRVGR